MQFNGGLVKITCAQRLHEIASEQLSRAGQSSDPLTRDLYVSAAKAYSEWALEMEQIARTTESIERSA